MRQLFTAGTTGTGFITRSLLQLDRDTVAEIQVKKYEPLLYSIANAFGFGENEAHGLVEEVNEYAHKQPASECLPFRIWLSRCLVYKCVFRLGSELFYQSGCNAEKNRPGSLGYYYRYRNAGELNLQDMPLSFRAVYILRYIIGFTTIEISQILNTTHSKVVERYDKALVFLDKHRKRRNQRLDVGEF
jgi:DNA-directed RNA polymerase specialized sigma24 family protein